MAGAGNAVVAGVSAGPNARQTGSMQGQVNRPWAADAGQPDGTARIRRCPPPNAFASATQRVFGSPAVLLISNQPIVLRVDHANS
jgi:hypothetical protein